MGLRCQRISSKLAAFWSLLASRFSAAWSRKTSQSKRRGPLVLASVCWGLLSRVARHLSSWGPVSQRWENEYLDAPRTLITRGALLEVEPLFEMARAFDESITLDEYSAGRLIASERSKGTPEESACFVDAELNRANRRGVSLTQHLTGGTGSYGSQGGRRKAATLRNPTVRHLVAARAVLSGTARGISQGAERFFDPRAQDRLHRAYRAGRTPGRVHSCCAQGTLKAWSYDLPKAGPYRCGDDGMPPSDAEAGSRPMAWVGPISGVDAWRVMLFRPSSYGAKHDAIYEAASRIISARSGLPAFLDHPATPLLALLAVGALFG